ncbi:hypothetical protein Vi05172_g12025 [Venturia inaequalis]|nr:hypothetical protein Vi05172_g12025 [Venturia inaequalis]
MKRAVYKENGARGEVAASTIFTDLCRGGDSDFTDPDDGDRDGNDPDNGPDGNGSGVSKPEEGDPQDNGPEGVRRVDGDERRELQRIRQSLSHEL